MLRQFIDIGKLLIIINIIVFLTIIIYKLFNYNFTKNHQHQSQSQKINKIIIKKDEKNDSTDETNNQKIQYPKHIAFIMDGNGRWAKKHNQTRLFGHINGSTNLAEIFFSCFSNGCQYLTFYVFAEQNWKREKEEIDNIFEIIYKKMKLYMKENIKYRILVQGRLDRVPKKLRKILTQLIEKTKDFEQTIILCLDYSGRSEILNACKTIIDKKLEPTYDNFKNSLYVKDIPDPDLIIRTSGEQRISDFLLWQLSYSEFYFTDIYWPEFTIKELEKAVIEYNKRHRRFGVGS